MKKVFKVFQNIFAVIGFIAVILVILYFCRKPYFEVDVYPSFLGRMENYVEDLGHEEVVRDHYVNLVPPGFEPFGSGNLITTDADRFWAAPESWR